MKDCRTFYDLLTKRGVHFIRPPSDQPWGTTQAVFEDLYGNVYVAESKHTDAPVSNAQPLSPDRP